MSRGIGKLQVEILAGIEATKSDDRRNIADIDRIALAARREEIVRRKAAVNKVEAGRQTGRGHGKVSAKLPEPISTRAESAKAAGVGERTYDAGKLILEAVTTGEVAPEVVEDIRRGRSAIHRVAKEVKESRQRTARQTDAAERQGATQ